MRNKQTRRQRPAYAISRHSYQSRSFRPKSHLKSVRCLALQAGGVDVLALAADRGDQVVAHYATHVIRSLADDPANNSLIDTPEELQSFMVSVLIDLMAVCVKANLRWDRVVADAQHDYRQEIEER